MPWKDDKEGPWGSKGESNGSSNPGNGQNPWNNRSGKGLDDIIKNGTEADHQIDYENKYGKNKLLLYLMIDVEYNV